MMPVALGRWSIRYQNDVERGHPVLSSVMKPEQIDLVGRQINFEASEHVRKALASLGRTEDVKLSPSNRQLIIADHFSDQIAVFGVSIDSSRNSKSVTLNSV